MSDAPDNWRDYEIAVARFIAAISPNARVTHDILVPDQHTGLPRQRDVWVEWVHAGLLPITALISCKFWSEPLNQQDIDHFNGEYLSSGARLGVIFAKSGFNDAAIAKCRALGFYSCKLYCSQPVELPQRLLLGLAYHVSLNPQFSIFGDTSRFQTWQDIFNSEVSDKQVFELLVELFEYYQSTAYLQTRWQYAATGKGTQSTISIQGATLQVVLSDIVRRAKLECTLVDGAYNLASDLFAGDQSTPWIDTQCDDPGPGWEVVTDLPLVMPKPFLGIVRGLRPIDYLAKLGKQLISKSVDENH